MKLFKILSIGLLSIVSYANASAKGCLNPDVFEDDLCSGVGTKCTPNDGWNWRCDNGSEGLVATVTKGNAQLNAINAWKLYYTDSLENKYTQNTEEEHWDDFYRGDSYYESYEYKYNDFTISYTSNGVRPGFGFNKDSGDDLRNGEYPEPFLKIKYNDQYSAYVTLLPGMGDDNYMNRPLVVGDAFDPGNKRSASTIYNKNQYSKLFDPLYSSGPRAQGYDVFFIDFSQGAGNIVINAGIELAFSQWLELQTNSKYVIGGPSMSGLISRLTLLLSEKENILKNVKGYISIDSPHQGASISTDFQQMIGMLALSCTTNLLEVDPRNQWLDLNTPAAYQMLYGHTHRKHGIGGSCGDSQWSASNEAHTNFFQFLENLGDFATNIPMVAIAYSNFDLPHGANTRDQTFSAIKDDFGLDLELKMGGDYTSVNGHELMPGSIGFWYWSNWNNKKGDENLRLQNIEGKIFKGTFVPIYSALDLNIDPNNLSHYVFDPIEPQSIDEKELTKYSPFDKLIWMTDYSKMSYQGRDIDRYEHIVFDDQLMARLLDGLNFIENQNYYIVPTIITPLLLN
ncbi:MAG: hypothetical protein OCC49_07510 [Fibrobacterales bacterium]